MILKRPSASQTGDDVDEIDGQLDRRKAYEWTKLTQSDKIPDFLKQLIDDAPKAPLPISRQHADLTWRPIICFECVCTCSHNASQRMRPVFATLRFK